MVSIWTMQDIVQENESFAEFVKRIREEKNLSLNAVVANSKRKGKGISNAYVSRIENGLQSNVTPRMLKALADGLQMPHDVIRAIYEGKTDKDEIGCDYLRALPPDIKATAVIMLRGLYEQHVKSLPLRELGSASVGPQRTNLTKLRKVKDSTDLDSSYVEPKPARNTRR